jgi:glutaconate CoA-transferase, subunit A
LSGPARLELSAAVQEHVVDGATVYVGNFGSQLHSVGYELIRQGRRNLHIVIPSGGILLDALLAAGVADTVTFTHCWSPVGPAAAHNFRDLQQTATKHVKFHELSFGALCAGLTAAAWRVPFLPVPVSRCTAYIREGLSDGYFCSVTSPFGEATVVRAIRPDIAFLYADTADRWGNGYVRGAVGDVLLAAEAADRTVLVVEETVSDEAMRECAANIPGVLVKAVVVQPKGVFPDGAIGRYPRDVEEYELYTELARTREGFAHWLELRARQ